MDRGAQHQAPVGSPSEGRHSPVEARQHLERVALAEPALAERERPDDADEDEQPDRDPQHQQGGPVRRDELEPGERQQPGRGRPEPEVEHPSA